MWSKNIQAQVTDQRNIVKQCDSFLSSLLEPNNTYTETIGWNIDNLLSYAENQQQAGRWLNHLLHFGSTLRYHPDYKTSKDTKYLLRNLPNYPSFDQTTPKIELTSISNMLQISTNHIDTVQKLIQARRQYYSELDFSSSNDTKYALNTVMHSMRVLRSATQATILKAIADLPDKKGYHASDAKILIARKKIEDALEINSYSESKNNIECHHFIQTHLVDNADIDYYKKLLDANGSLGILIQEARDFFGNNTAQWEQFWLILCIDPQLFLLAAENTPHHHQITPLLRMAKLLNSTDDFNLEEIFYQSHQMDWQFIKGFVNTRNTNLPANTKLLSVLRTRFLAVLIGAWQNAKTYTPTQGTQNLGDSAALEAILLKMDQEVSRNLEITGMSIKIYNYYQEIELEAPALAASINFYSTWLSQCATAIFSPISNYFRPYNLNDALSTNRHQEPYPSKELLNQYLNGAMDPEPMLDCFDSNNPEVFLTSSSPRLAKTK